LPSRAITRASGWRWRWAKWYQRTEGGAILKDEEDHIDEIEGQLDQFKQMGPQNYLVEQIH